MTAVLITSPLVIQTTCTTSPEVHEPFYQNREVLKSGFRPQPASNSQRGRPLIHVRPKQSLLVLFNVLQQQHKRL